MLSLLLGIIYIAMGIFTTGVLFLNAIFTNTTGPNFWKQPVETSGTEVRVRVRLERGTSAISSSFFKFYLILITMSAALSVSHRANSKPYPLAEKWRKYEIF